MVLGYAVWREIERLLADTTLPVVVMVGVVALALGLVVLLVSVIREKLFVRCHDPYKDVQR